MTGRPDTPLMDIRRENERAAAAAGLDPYSPIPYDHPPTPAELAAIDDRAEVIGRWEFAEELAVYGASLPDPDDGAADYAAHVGDALAAVFADVLPRRAARRSQAAATLAHLEGLGIRLSARFGSLTPSAPLDADLSAQVADLNPELWDLLDEPEPPRDV